MILETAAIIILAVLVLYFTALSALVSGSLPAILLPIGISVCIIAAAACLKNHFRKTESPATVPKINPAWIIPALLLAMLILQTIYLPPALDRLTGTTRASENAAAREVITSISTLTGDPAPDWFAFSRNRSGALRLLLHVTTLSALGLLTVMLPPAYRFRLLVFLVILGAATAVLGIMHQWVFPRPKTIWWLYDIRHGRPVAGFPSRTHYGGFLALLAQAALALALYFFHARKPLRAVLSSAALAIITTATMLSLSRGAVIALITGSGVTAIAFLGALRIKALLALTAATLLAGLFGWIALSTLPDEVLQPTTERMQTLSDATETPSARLRFEAWGDALRIWRRYPLAGCGANGYRMLQTVVRQVDGSKRFAHAENQYLQLLAEGGIIGALFGMAGLIAVILGLLNKSRRIPRSHENSNQPDTRLRPENMSHLFTAAAWGCLAAAMLHNAVDFPLHNPLYAAGAVVIIAAALAPHSRAAVPGLRWGMLLLMTTAYLLINTGFGRQSDKLRHDWANLIDHAPREDLLYILRDAPTNWYAWYHLGSRMMNIPRWEAAMYAEQCLERAVEYNRGNAAPWQMLGWIRVQRGNYDSAEDAYREMNRIRPWMRIPRYREQQF